MADIAEACGVSKMTVSRVLSGKEYGVGKRTKKIVLEAVEKYNYTPNMLAKNFATHRSGYIGLALPFEGILGSSYFSELMIGIQDGLQGSGCQIAIFDTLSESFDNGAKVASLYYQKRVDGIIAVAPHSNDSFFDTLTQQNVPLIIAGEPTFQTELFNIAIDDQHGIKTLVDYLIEQGHRNIGFLSGPKQVLSSSFRKAGFISAMNENGLEVNQEWILAADYERYKARSEFLNLLSKPNVPTAIVAANDLMALGIMDAAFVKGIKIPEELSVVGFDDIPPSEFSQPPLTTIHQPIRELGKIAATTLRDWSLNDSKPEKISPLTPHLVIRKSVAKI